MEEKILRVNDLKDLFLGVIVVKNQLWFMTDEMKLSSRIEDGYLFTIEDVNKYKAKHISDITRFRFINFNDDVLLSEDKIYFMNSFSFINKNSSYMIA